MTIRIGGTAELLEIADSARPGALLVCFGFGALYDAKRDISKRSEQWRKHSGATRAAARSKKQPPGSQGLLAAGLGEQLPPDQISTEARGRLRDDAIAPKNT